METSCIVTWTIGNLKLRVTELAFKHSQGTHGWKSYKKPKGEPHTLWDHQELYSVLGDLSRLHCRVSLWHTDGETPSSFTRIEYLFFQQAFSDHGEGQFYESVWLLHI